MIADYIYKPKNILYLFFKIRKMNLICSITNKNQTMKKNNLSIILGLATCLCLFIQFELFAQGCVAVRPMSCSGVGNSNGSPLLNKGQFQVSTTYRYFKSYKHFKGDSEQKERVELGTEVINIAHSIDLGLTYAISDRLNISMNAPLIYYYRSSLYEHYGNSIKANPEQKRFGTQAKGLGDIRISTSYWLLKQGKDSSGNISVGLGIKLPTGNSNVQDDFHRLTNKGEDSLIQKAVDQSIHLGDGGVGYTIETQGYRNVGSKSSFYFNGFYMFNPQNYNKTLNRGTLVGVDPLIAYHSIADQYMIRFGLNFKPLSKQNLFLNLGARYEGIPAKDLIGKSEGWRRPGYIVSVEPGITYLKGKATFVLNVPIALYRNRVKNTYDLADPAAIRHGDAAFADYLINFTFLYRFGKLNHHKME